MNVRAGVELTEKGKVIKGSKLELPGQISKIEYRKLIDPNT